MAVPKLQNSLLKQFTYCHFSEVHFRSKLKTRPFELAMSLQLDYLK